MTHSAVILQSVLTAKNITVHAVGHIPNVYGEYEWLKWLTYIPASEAAKIQKINNKKDKLLHYKEIDHIVTIIKKYVLDKEHDLSFAEALDYMESHSLDDLINSKLSTTEKEALDAQAYEYLKENKDAFKVSLDIGPEEYMELSIYDAYVLHRITAIKSFEANKKSGEMLGSMVERNLVMRQRSEINANNANPCQ